MLFSVIDNNKHNIRKYIVSKSTEMLTFVHGALSEHLVKALGLFLFLLQQLIGKLSSNHEMWPIARIIN